METELPESRQICKLCATSTAKSGVLNLKSRSEVMDVIKTSHRGAGYCYYSMLECVEVLMVHRKLKLHLFIL